MPPNTEQKNVQFHVGERVDYADMNGISTQLVTLVKEVLGFVVGSGLSAREGDKHGRVLTGFSGASGAGLTFNWDDVPGIAIAPDGSLLESVSGSPPSALAGLSASKDIYVHAYITEVDDTANLEDRRFRRGTAPYEEYTDNVTVFKKSIVGIHLKEMTVGTPTLANFDTTATISGVPKTLVALYCLTTDGSSVVSTTDFRPMLMPMGTAAYDEYSTIVVGGTEGDRSIRSIRDVLGLVAKQIRNITGKPDWWTSPVLTIADISAGLADIYAILTAFVTTAHTWTATQTFNGVAGNSSDAGAGLASVDNTVTTRKCLWKIKATDARYYRFYVTSGTGLVSPQLEITWNANWDDTAGKWVEDWWVGGEQNFAIKFTVTASGIKVGTIWDTVYDLTDPAHGWTDTQWRYYSNLTEDGSIRFFRPGTESNPAATSSMYNTICAKNTVKSWANVNVVAGVFTIVDGYNLTYSGMPDNYHVTFALPGPLASTAYAVVASMPNGTNTQTGPATTIRSVPKVTAKGTNNFTLTFPQFDSAILFDDLTLATCTFDIIVLGTQTT